MEIGMVRIVTTPCRETTVQTYHSSRPKDWAIKPVVIHVDRGGAVRFPGNSDAKVPKGFNKVELRTIPEIEKFEREMNRKFHAEAEQHHENEARVFGEIRAQLRSELRQRMQTMSALGRDFARAAMEANDRRPRKSSDTGFHLQVLHFNASNREPFREGKGYKPTRWI